MGSPHWWRGLWRRLVENKVLTCFAVFSPPSHNPPTIYNQSHPIKKVPRTKNKWLHIEPLVLWAQKDSLMSSISQWACTPSSKEGPIDPTSLSDIWMAIVAKSSLQKVRQLRRAGEKRPEVPACEHRTMVSKDNLWSISHKLCPDWPDSVQKADQ